MLISTFVAAANNKVLEKDDARVICFRRCGILMMLERSDEDDLIKPQGGTKLHLKNFSPLDDRNDPPSC